MPVNDVYQIEIIGVAQGEYCENILHVNLTSDTTSNELAAAAAVVNLFQTTWKTTYLAALAADYELSGFRARRISPTGGPSAAFTTPGAVGTVSGVSATSCIGAGIVGPFQEYHVKPPRTTPLWRSAKMYMPSAPDAYIEGNQLSTAYITAIGAIVAILESWTVGATVGFHYGVWSRTSAQFIQINNWTISDKIFVQRRRLKPVL